MSTAAPASGGTASSETLKREFSLWSAFALAFAFISPIVALYAIFGFAFAAAGPSMWWAFLIVMIGQLFVAATFAELSSKWPFEGAVYQWARRLRGESYGWWAGWAYIWTLVLAVATVCYGIAGFVPVVLDVEPFSSGVALLVAIGFVGIVSFINTVGRGAMKLFVSLSIAAEVIGSVGIGIVLLLFHRENSFSSLFESAGAAQDRAATCGAGCSPPWRSSAGRSWASRRRAPSPRRSWTRGAPCPRRRCCPCWSSPSS
jgi:amino acid transporter